MTNVVRFIGTTVCALLVASTFSFAQEPIDLGTLGGNSSQANAIDILGQAAGSADRADGTTHAFVTDAKDNKLTDLGSLLSGGNSFALGVSLKGVVGLSDVEVPLTGISSHGFYYQNGQLTDIGTLGGTASQANAINNEGLAVGNSLTTDDLASHAFVWNSKDKQFKDLGTLGGTNSSANGVNDFGLVVGVADTANSDEFGNPISHAVIWDLVHNKTTDLGTLPGGVSSQANAVNELGAVAGSSTDALGVTHAFLYFNGKLTDLGTLGGSFASATAINDLGAVVGFSNTTGDAASDAFIWTPWGGLKDLNSFLPPNSGWTLSSANGINDFFRISGAGAHNDENHAFVLQLSSPRK